VRGAQTHEFAARIGQLHQRPELNLLDLSLLDLGLRRTSQNERRYNRCGTDTNEHDGLTGNFLF
jgi:hypothetical protein